jgi:hypothetical protein
MDSLSSLLNVTLNDTTCKMFGFDIFNGTHCYKEPTSEWTDGPHNGVFGSFEELYYRLDETGRIRLMDAMHHYHKAQEGGMGYSLYLYILFGFLAVQLVGILWHVAKHGWGGGRVQLWPWRCFPGVVAEINELLVRIGVLLVMAVANAVLWPFSIPVMVFLLVFRVLGYLSNKED